MTGQGKPHDIDAWLQALGEPSADRDYTPGHERVLKLLNALETRGFVLRKPRLRIRVAGTNGKGSTTHFLAAAFQASGLKVGLYTSPHILSFHERMCVDDNPITQESLLELMTNVMPLALDVGTSYFETATVLALLYFSQQQVDVEILEAGVGAKLDATTAVKADIGLLTSVGLDHQTWLGDTLEEITQDKAYVFQGCDVCISVEQNETVRRVLEKQVRHLQYAKLFTAPLSMLGQHQSVNAGLAYAAIIAGQQKLSSICLHNAREAMCQLQVAGRMQRISYGKHTFYLDAAHNEHAVQALLPTLSNMQPMLDVMIICTREDRDLSGCLSGLERMTHKMIVMTGSGQYPYQTIEGALLAETQGIDAGTFLVLGSFVTLGKVFEWMDARKC
ncbi:MAG: Mur ligase family protein [Ghiorsea sp.]|nr:Mur ligase family protein [Ghiorsea sp.]